MGVLLRINDLTLEQAALAYASMGWPVLPLEVAEKRPMGRLVHTGLKEATTDLDTIRAWWSRHPGANIGLRTGDAFDVLDLDGELAVASMAIIAPDYKHPGPVASTGKGYHLLFEPTGARNAANKLPGIDFRGQSGYIVASPSLHPNGHRYRWLRDGDLPTPTEWLDRLVTPARTTPVSGYDPEDMTAITTIWERTFASIAPLLPLGHRFITNCIWHDDSTPSLVLYPENNSFYCFGCGEWGDSIDLGHLATTHLGSKPSDLRASVQARAS